MNPQIFTLAFAIGFLTYLAVLLYISINHRGPVTRLPWEYHTTLILISASHVTYYHAQLTSQPAGFSLLLAMAGFVVGGQRLLTETIDRWKQ